MLASAANSTPAARALSVVLLAIAVVAGLHSRGALTDPRTRRVAVRVAATCARYVSRMHRLPSFTAVGVALVAVSRLRMIRSAAQRAARAEVAPYLTSIAGAPRSVARYTMDGVEALSTRSSRYLSHGGEYVRHAVRRRARDVQAFVHRRVDRQLDALVHVASSRLKESLQDPDMPALLQGLVGSAVDLAVPDVKREVSRKADEILSVVSPVSRGRRTQRRRPPSPVRGERRGSSPVPEPATARGRGVRSGARGWLASTLSTASGTVRSRVRTAFPRRPRGVREAVRMARALVLYTLSPYDRSFWSCVRDPLWVAFTLLGLLPYAGPVFWLCLYAAKDRSDEHQLCDFILSFKAAQFASVGVLSVARGVVLYLLCTSRDPPTCEVEGPRLQSWDAAFFALQILIVWAAFRALPHTRAARRPSAVSHESLALRRGSLPAGGHLFRLFWYDSAVLLTSSLLLLVGVSLGGVGAASALDLPRWNTEAALYWTRALYGVLAAPFVPFKVPLLGALLTHAARTGYDPQGRTMLLQRRVPFLRKPVGGDYARPPPAPRARPDKLGGAAPRPSAPHERAERAEEAHIQRREHGAG